MLKRAHTMHLPFLFALMAIPSCRDKQAANSADTQTKKATPVQPTTTEQSSAEGMTLANAIEDWIRLLEADDLHEASQKWARNDDAKKQMERFWPKLRGCNEAYDYRKWLEEATKAEVNEAFTVGGHQYGFMHTDWVATPIGWRIQSVWICR